MSNTIKKNDWIAVNLNAPENMTIDSLAVYGITPENTGLQSEDYYINKKQVVNSPLFTNEDGSFNGDKFHSFYESALRSYNEYQNVNFTDSLIDNIEKTAYDVFSPFESPRFDDSAYLFEMRDPRRTTHGLGNIFETGSPVFDEREVAQANKMRDENGNVLDWTPNEKGGIFKGLLRPSAAMAIYENDEFDENGRLIHHKGEYKLDESGDPYYELLGNKSSAGRETLKYWDTITDDDSYWNKVDFFDSDGLKKSIGGTLMKTAVTFLPYFIPGVGEIMGYVGASIALGQSLPVLAKSLDALLTGTTNNDFGNTMNSVGNWFDRFKSSQSREAQGKFYSFENIGDIISTSAGQLFQQRNIAELSRKIFTGNDMMQAARLGRGLSYGFMAVTSGEEAYNNFKEAGASDAMAGIATLATMSAFYGLFHVDYFKDFMFTNTFMDENIALRQTVKELVKEQTVPAYKEYSEIIAKKNLSELGKRLERVKLYTKIRDKIKDGLEKLELEARPTIKQTLEANNGNGIPFKQRLGMYLTRAANEGFEETTEEVMQDLTKGITLGLNALGVDVTEDNKELDFHLSIRDMASRYMQSFIGGALGGAIFEGFNHWEGGPYDSLLEKDLNERLAWYYRNGYGSEVEDRLAKLRDKGKLANTELSATPLRTKNINGKEVIVFGQSKNGDSQNDAVYNAIKTYLDVLKGALNSEALFTDDNTIFKEMYKNLVGDKEYDSEDPMENLYHFLNDVDNAKVKTITQMGFLKLVGKRINSLISEILAKKNEIASAKDELRRRNHLTDADSSKEKEIFKESSLLKKLEDELKELREEYEELTSGKRAGWFLGYAQMLAEPRYMNWYQNPEYLKNEVLTGYPQSELENFVKVRTGLDYNAITDDDLKKKLENEFDAYKKLTDEDQKLALYKFHLKLGEQFAPEIMNQNAEYEGWLNVDPVAYMHEYFKTLAANNQDLLLNQAVEAFEARIEEAKKIENGEEQANAVNNAITSLIIAGITDEGTTEGLDPVTAVQKLVSAQMNIKKATQLLQALAKNVVDSKAIIDLTPVRRVIMNSIFKTAEENWRLKTGIVDPELRMADTIVTKFFNNQIGKYEFDTSDESVESAIAWLEDRFSSDVVGQIIEDAKKISEEYTYYDLQDAYNEYFDKTYRLFRDTNSQKFLASLIDDLKQALVRGDRNIRDKENAIIDYVTKNSTLTAKDAKDLIAQALNVIGSDLVKLTEEYNTTLAQQKMNPILDLLKKFDIAQGGKLFNIIQTIESEESIMAQNPNEYRFSSPNVENQLNAVLSYISALTAVINSTLDGMNEALNTTSEFQYAVTNEDLKPVYLNGIESIVKRIGRLIVTSRQNQQRTTRAQQETEISAKAERVKTLTGIGQISFGEGENDTLDFAKIWAKTGYSVSSASIDDAKAFSEAYDAFVIEVSSKLHTIYGEAAAKGEEYITAFIDAIIDRLGEDVYLQNAGEISEESKITAYGNTMWLIRQTITDPSELNSLWKTACANNPQLISLFGQENASAELLAHLIDFFEGHNLFDAFHKRLKERFPQNRTDDFSYTSNKDVANQLANIDGVAGVGKTQGVNYLTLEMLRLKYNDISALAMSKEVEAVTNLQGALNQKQNNPVQGLTFEQFKNIITDDGKLFDLSSANVKRGKIVVFSETDKNNLKNIPAEKIDQLFGNGKRILFVDESGLFNAVEWGFLLELAKAHNFFIAASGDMFQNQALNPTGQATSGLEDFFYHKIAPLTVSMRAEYNGQYNNTITVRNLLKSIEDDLLATGKTDYGNAGHDNATKKVLEKANPVKLLYAQSNLAGTSKIESDALESTINELLKQVEQLKESVPDKDHYIAIAVDNNEKFNLYNTTYANNENIKVLYADKIQGREFDYVIIDKGFNAKSKYLGLKDFYTMLTRSKIGSIFIDDIDYIHALFFVEFDPNENAALPVMGGTAEAKQAIFQKYIEWKNNLTEKYPKYETAVPAAVTTGNGAPAASTAGKQQIAPQQVVRKFELYGQKEKSPEEVAQLEKIKTDPVQRHKYYYEKLKAENPKTSYFSKLLHRREEILKDAQSIDFDLFNDELKDMKTTVFEDLPGTIFEESSKADDKRKFNHRVLIALIARGILNNNTNEKRLAYFTAAANAITKYATKSALKIRDLNIALQSSFGENGTGVFVAHGNYMFYAFTYDDSSYAIPIYKLKEPVKSTEYFRKETQFSQEVGSIRVSTKGELRFTLKDVLNEIDGLLTDKDNNIQLTVAVPNDALYNKVKEILKVDYDKGVELKGRLKELSGKTVIAQDAASSAWLNFEGIFEFLRRNGELSSLVQKEYDFDNLVQAFDILAIQKDIDFSKWLSIVSVLYRLHRKEKITLSDKETQDLVDFFGSAEFVKELNNIGTDSGKKSERLNVLKRHKVLHNNSIESLCSVFMRYIQFAADEDLKGRFTQNFITWLGKLGSNQNDDGRIHLRGFAVKFVTTNNEGRKENHTFRVLPRNTDNGGYTIDYIGALNKYQISRLIQNDDDDINLLFDSIEGNFTKVVERVLNTVADRSITVKLGEQETTTPLKGLVDAIADPDVREAAFKTGDLELFPVDAYYDVKDGEVAELRRYYSPFETDLYEWLVMDPEKKKAIPIPNIESVDKFLKNDSKFKYGLFADIKADYKEENNEKKDEAMWVPSVDLINDTYSIDVEKVIQPTYKSNLGATAIGDVNPEESSDIYDRFSKIFESGTSIESENPAVNINDLLIASNGAITGSITVNSAWVNKYLPDNNLEVKDSYKITKIDYLNQEIIIDGKNIAVDDIDGIFGPIVGEKMSDHVITGSDWRISINGDRITYNFLEGTSWQKTGFTVIGQNEDTKKVLLKLDTGTWKEIILSDEDYKKFFSSREVSNYSYLGQYERTQWDKVAYYTADGKYYINEHTPDTSEYQEIPIGSVPSEVLNTAKRVVSDLSNLTSYTVNNTTYYFGDHSVTAGDLQSWMSTSNSTELTDTVYTLIARKDNNLWIKDSKDNIQQIKVVKSSVERALDNNTIDLITKISDTGAEPDIIKNIVNTPIQDPTKFIEHILNKYNSIQQNAYETNLESEEPLKMLAFINGEFKLNSSRPRQIELKKAIYRKLVKQYGDSLEIQDWRNTDKDDTMGVVYTVQGIRHNDEFFWDGVNVSKLDKKAQSPNIIEAKIQELEAELAAIGDISNAGNLEALAIAEAQKGDISNKLALLKNWRSTNIATLKAQLQSAFGEEYVQLMRAMLAESKKIKPIDKKDNC